METEKDKLATLIEAKKRVDGEDGRYANSFVSRLLAKQIELLEKLNKQ